MPAHPDNPSVCQPAWPRGCHCPYVAISRSPEESDSGSLKLHGKRVVNDEFFLTPPFFLQGSRFYSGCACRQLCGTVRVDVARGGNRSGYRRRRSVHPPPSHACAIRRWGGTAKQQWTMYFSSALQTELQYPGT